MRESILLNSDLLDEARDFRDWLRSNRTHLNSYAPDEIAMLALSCGFSHVLIYGEICDNITRLKRLMLFWESPLSEHWMDVTSYQRGTNYWPD